MRNPIESMRALAAAFAGLLVLLSMGGCSGTRAPEPDAPGSPRVDAAAPAQPPATETRPASRPAAPVEKPAVAAGVPEPAPKLEPAPKVSQAPAPTANNGKQEAPPAPVAKPPAPVAKPAPKAEPAPAPKPPALDLATLEKRLKDTSAIGLMTKLALKNQVDELLDRFRAHYDGRVKTTVAQLRQPYDMLILKVLSLLQDGDPSLAKAIADSREAIWTVLTDPTKFRNL